ncbi:MAG: hypothetical protein V3U23_09475 [Kiloniellales bacterium]
MENRGPDAIAFNCNLGEQPGAILRELVSGARLGLSALTLAMHRAPGSLCRGHAPGRALDGLEIALKGGQVGGPAYFSRVRDGGA